MSRSEHVTRWRRQNHDSIRTFYRRKSDAHDAQVAHAADAYALCRVAVPAASVHPPTAIGETATPLYDRSFYTTAPITLAVSARISTVHLPTVRSSRIPRLRRLSNSHFGLCLRETAPRAAPQPCWYGQRAPRPTPADPTAAPHQGTRF